MWNNLKSDIYRMTHMRAFYVAVAICFSINLLLLFTTGISFGSPMASFMSNKNTFIEYLYYILKSPTFLLLTLIFLCIFHNDEYTKGFVKNTMPIMHNKGILIIERYLFDIILCIILWVCSMVPGFIREIISPLAASGSSFHIGDYLLYVIVQILITCTVASFIMMLNHLTRSKVVIILYACFYSMFILYMIETSLALAIFDDPEIVNNTLFALSGHLPYSYSWNGYSTAIYLIIIYTLLYNGISYLILKKKDI